MHNLMHTQAVCPMGLFHRRREWCIKRTHTVTGTRQNDGVCYVDTAASYIYSSRQQAPLYSNYCSNLPQNLHSRVEHCGFVGATSTAQHHGVLKQCREKNLLWTARCKLRRLGCIQNLSLQEIFRLLAPLVKHSTLHEVCQCTFESDAS